MKNTKYFLIWSFIIGIIITSIIVINIDTNDKTKSIIATELYKNISKISSYNNPSIPNGFKKVETETASWELENGIPKGWNNGLVIEDEKGNQFLWVPVKFTPNLEDYTVNNGYVYANVGINYNEIEFIQILKYQGFYVARYEAGLPNIISEQTNEFSEESNNVEGIPTSQKNQIVWNFLSWQTAKINAQKMYESNNLKSDLITNRQWQDILLWISNLGYNLEDSQEYGNYSNTIFNFSGYYSTDYGKTYKYSENKSKQTFNMILSTGASERNKINNIYDLAGNVAEFVDVYRWIDNNEIKESLNLKGGYYDNISNYYSISSNMSISTPNSKQGFRIVLYLE